MENRYKVRPVAKAMRLLQCIGASPAPLSLKAICSDANLPKTTAFRYLRTLCESGVVSHDGQRDLYTLDVRMLSMIRLGAGLRRLRDICLPHMRDLESRFGETINLGVLDGTDVVYVEIIEGPRAWRMQARVGGRDPAHATALGKAILAFLPDQVRRDVVPPRLRKITRRTLGSVPEFMADLDEVRRNGYAEEVGESEDEAACLAAPIFDHAQRVTAALSMAAPSIRMVGGRREEIAEALMSTARRISATLDLPCGALEPAGRI